MRLENVAAAVVEIKPNEIRGWSDVASIADVKDANAGFLSSEGFVVKVEIRRKLPENERCSLSVDENSGTYTVSILFSKHHR